MDQSVDFNRLLEKEVQQFIKDHEKDDESVLVLKNKEILGIPVATIAQQIVGRRKAKTKLPTLYSTPAIVYPPKLNLEQCSSEVTAQFKAGLIKGKLSADLTGGFGIDSLYLAKSFTRVMHIEPNAALLQIVKHNHEALGTHNIIYHESDAESFLIATHDHFDLIYIDPSRRSTGNRKVFKFSECSPNVVALMPTLLERSDFVLIKASPLIDIQQAIRELGFVSQVYIVGYDNECKEVLFMVSKLKAEPIIKATDLSEDQTGNEPFSFTLSEENKSEVSYSEPLSFLYEPTAMVLKAGAFKLVGKKFGLKKIAPNTHLYSSNEIVPEFPGRIFKVVNFLKSDSKSVREFLPDGYANIISRNYPLTPSQLRKKLKTIDGGQKFVIGFSGVNKKHLVLATRVK